jgi:hypothetical protein
MMAHVGPPTYPAPMQHMFLILSKKPNDAFGLLFTPDNVPSLLLELLGLANALALEQIEKCCEIKKEYQLALILTRTVFHFLYPAILARVYTATFA